MFSRNLAQWVQNEPKMDYLTMSAKYSKINDWSNLFNVFSILTKF